MTDINVSFPNDNLGDVLRDAFIKVNQNKDELLELINSQENNDSILQQQIDDIEDELIIIQDDIENLNNQFGSTQNDFDIIYNAIETINTTISGISLESLRASNNIMGGELIINDSVETAFGATTSIKSGEIKLTDYNGEYTIIKPSQFFSRNVNGNTSFYDANEFGFYNNTTFSNKRIRPNPSAFTNSNTFYLPDGTASHYTIATEEFVLTSTGGLSLSEIVSSSGTFSGGITASNGVDTTELKDDGLYISNSSKEFHLNTNNLYMSAYDRIAAINSWGMLLQNTLFGQQVQLNTDGLLIEDVINDSTPSGSINVRPSAIDFNFIKTLAIKAGDTNYSTFYLPNGTASEYTLATTTDLNSKQDTLLSGTNIKTIDGYSLLGTGDITLSDIYVPYSGGTSDLNLQGYDIYSNIYRIYDPVNDDYGSIQLYDGLLQILGDTAGDKSMSLNFNTGDILLRSNDTGFNLTLDRLDNFTNNHIISWPDSDGVLALATSNINSTNIYMVPNAVTVKSNLDLKANIASPTFTGTLTTPSLSISGGSTLNYVRGNGSVSNFNSGVINALLSGFTAGANSTVLNTDGLLVGLGKLQGQINARAPIASPTFTGTPSAPTAAVGTSTTQIATTAFVNLSNVIQLKDFYTDVSNVGTTHSDLYSFTTLANTLILNGQKLKANFSGIGNAAAKPDFQVLFGGQVIFESIQTAMTVDRVWDIEVTIIRTGTTTARCIVTYGSIANSLLKVYTELTGMNFTTTNIIKLTASGETASNEVTAKIGNVTLYPAAP